VDEAQWATISAAGMVCAFNEDAALNAAAAAAAARCRLLLANAKKLEKSSKKCGASDMWT